MASDVGKPGNKLGRGGARQGAGRPPDQAKKAVKEIMAGRVDGALAVIDDLLASTQAEPKDRLKAAELVLAYAYHKPTQPLQHAGEMQWVKSYGPNMPTESLMPPRK